MIQVSYQLKCLLETQFKVIQPGAKKMADGEIGLCNNSLNRQSAAAKLEYDFPCSISLKLAGDIGYICELSHPHHGAFKASNIQCQEGI